MQGLEVCEVLREFEGHSCSDIVSLSLLSGGTLPVTAWEFQIVDNGKLPELWFPACKPRGVPSVLYTAIQKFSNYRGNSRRLEGSMKARPAEV